MHRLLSFILMVMLLCSAPGALAASKPISESINSLEVSFECLGALAENAAGTQGALARALVAGDRLLALVASDAQGRSGWSYTLEWTKESEKCGAAGALDAFSDGTCNPPGTPYMIQTGYAIAALAQLYLATGDAKYLKPAVKAAKDSWSLGVAPKSCSRCFFYWYSYHPNDLGRYVRNTNMIMALGLTWLHVATGDPHFRERALAVAAEESEELRRENYGYFGVDDPKYIADPETQSQYIENHIGHQVKAFKDMAILLNQPKLLADSTKLLDAFMNCSNDRCLKGGCAAWAAPSSCRATWTISPCILGDANAVFRKQCDQARESLRNLSPYQAFLAAPSDLIRKMATSRKPDAAAGR